MKRLEYCYHTHTKRCGHAIGEDEEYVQSAINSGLKRLGFSDHVMLPDIAKCHSRGGYEELDDYVNSINSLKEKYKDKIEINLGFEAEYSKRFLEYYKSLLSSKKIEYLILGQHFNFDNTDKPIYIKFYHDDINELYSYCDHLIEGMETGLFSYVAHPDCYMMQFKEWNKDCEIVARRILEKAEELHLPLEINGHQKRFWRDPDYQVYPFDKFWEIASEYNVDVVVGHDAHDPKEFECELEFAFELIDKYNLHFLKDYKIKRIA